MSKIDQKTVLRSLSVSSLCLFLSLSSALAMEEERPRTAAAASASASFSAFPFSTTPEEQRDLIQARLNALKKLEPLPEHRAGFQLIDKIRAEVNALLHEISQLTRSLPSTSSSPGETSSSDESALGARQVIPPETELSLNPQILSLTNQIHTSLNQLTEALRANFGFIQTILGYYRFSETFHRKTLETLRVQTEYYKQKNSEHPGDYIDVLEVLGQAHETLAQRIEGIGRDARFKSYWKVGRNPIGYAPIERLGNPVVITVPPTSFHLFAAMMDLLNDTHQRLGTLPEGNSLSEKGAFKYGIYGDYFEEYTMHWQEKLKKEISQSSSAS